jgi:hypothetical protein
MLPGFRFLFAAIVLSMSVLIFGLGAAALLRAAHEQFASTPTRRAPPEQVFARQNDPPIPTLALLRIEPEVDEKVPDNITGTAIRETVAPAAQAPEADREKLTAAEPEKLAALKTEEPVSAEPAKPETPVAETTPAIAATPAEAPIADEEVKVAAIAETPVTVAASPTPEPVAEAPSLEGNAAALKVATLGGHAVTIAEPAAAKPAVAKPNRSVNRKRAQRARERRRLAAARRALLARQAAAQQQAADPFALTPVTRSKQ